MNDLGSPPGRPDTEPRASSGRFGVVVGLAGAFALTRLMEKMLYEVSPSDPVTYGAVAAALGLVGVAASSLPARRASRVDPVAALRHE